MVLDVNTFVKRLKLELVPEVEAADKKHDEDNHPGVACPDSVTQANSTLLGLAQSSGQRLVQEATSTSMGTSSVLSQSLLGESAAKTKRKQAPVTLRELAFIAIPVYIFLVGWWLAYVVLGFLSGMLSSMLLLPALLVLSLATTIVQLWLAASPIAESIIIQVIELPAMKSAAFKRVEHHLYHLTRELVWPLIAGTPMEHVGEHIVVCLAHTLGEGVNLVDNLLDVEGSTPTWLKDPEKVRHALTIGGLFLLGMQLPMLMSLGMPSGSPTPLAAFTIALHACLLLMVIYARRSLSRIVVLLASPALNGCFQVLLPKVLNTEKIDPLLKKVDAATAPLDLLESSPTAGWIDEYMPSSWFAWEVEDPEEGNIIKEISSRA